MKALFLNVTSLFADLPINKQTFCLWAASCNQKDTSSVTHFVGQIANTLPKRDIFSFFQPYPFWQDIDSNNYFYRKGKLNLIYLH